jgi:hypothetical protein
LSETPDAARFARSTRGYDAYGLSFHEGMRSALRVFWSVEWHDLLARLAGVTPTFNVNGGLHHHTVGSGNGRVHNDLNPGWFPDEPLPANDIRLSSPRHCDYYSGASASSPTAENVRALAMIFFLANGPWRPGDGGETGLYESPRQAIDRPSAVVPPLDNTMLVFECTPFSYHAFLSNRRRERNSVILWLHRRRAEVLSRWGEAAIVRWPQRQR